MSPGAPRPRQFEGAVTGIVLAFPAVVVYLALCRRRPRLQSMAVRPPSWGQSIGGLCLGAFFAQATGAPRRSGPETGG